MTSSKIKLNNVTLVAVTGKDREAHEQAIEKSCEGIEYGAVRLVWDDQITCIDDWNYFVIYRLHHYVDTTHALLIHPDGYVINPHLWDDEWLNLDFIGSPWPLPTDDYSYRDTKGRLQRVGNSVSLRSKKILQLPDRLHLPWEPYFGNTNEDGKLCCHWRVILEKAGCKYATFDQALKFGKEAPLPENEGLETFLFHHYDFI